MTSDLLLQRRIPLMRMSKRPASPPVRDGRLISALLPYFHRALDLRMRSGKAPSGLSVPLHAIEALTFGALICDRGGGVVYANTAAESMASGRLGLVFKTRQKSISALLSLETQKLLQLIEAAAAGRGSQSLVLTGHDGSASLMVLMSRLPVRDAASVESNVLVAVRQIGGGPSFGTARLIELFRLSPAQAILAIGLYEGKSFEDIADERGVKVTTLRTHFAEVLARTGSTSLRDLVRLLGSIPPLR